MLIVKYLPTLLFFSFVIQTMILRQFTYQTGLICMILGLVAFGFSFFDTRNDLKNMRKEIEDMKKDYNNKLDEVSTRVTETSSVLNAVKVQNNISTRRM